jgi:hypothetical protein
MHTDETALMSVMGWHFLFRYMKVFYIFAIESTVVQFRSEYYSISILYVTPKQLLADLSGVLYMRLISFQSSFA